ncbi:MAG: hypothetical protein RL335_993, partial [Bacteroidota bacterium]
MYRFIQYVFFTGLFIPLSIFAQNQPVIKVKATAPVAPLIREQTRNVFLHLAIYTDSTG